MILSGKSIRKAVEAGYIGVDPEPEPEQYQPATLDVRMGKFCYYPAEDSLSVSQDGHIFPPGKFYLGHTQDVIDLPADMVAFMTGRSSVGRKGLIVHCTAGLIDPGFEGDLTLEIVNVSDQTVFVGTGERVGQLMFFPTDEITEGYDGTFQGQRGPTKPDGESAVGGEIDG